MNIWFGLTGEEALVSLSGEFSATINKDGLTIYLHDVMIELDSDEAESLYNIFGFSKGLLG